MIGKLADKLNKVIDPISKVLTTGWNKFNNFLKGFGRLDIGRVFTKFSDLVEDLPGGILKFGRFGKKFEDILAKFRNLPKIVERLSTFTKNIENMLHDASDDLMQFYEVCFACCCFTKIHPLFIAETKVYSISHCPGNFHKTCPLLEKYLGLLIRVISLSPGYKF